MSEDPHSSDVTWQLAAVVKAEMKAPVSLHRFAIAKLSGEWPPFEVEHPVQPPTPELKVAFRMLERGKSSARAEERESVREDEEEEDPWLVGPELALLPPEICTHLLQFCSARCLASLAATSSFWRDRIACERDLWQKISDSERTKLGMGLGETWEDMLAKLPADDCRVAVFMWERSSPESALPLLIIWVPDASRLLAQVVYRATALGCKAALGLATEIQATSWAELSAAFVEKRLKARGFV